MKIEINIAAIRRSKWYEYVVRFAFGGVVTALAGIIAKRYGPEVGGLFLAFPAIFPATATLLEEASERAGMSKTVYLMLALKHQFQADGLLPPDQAFPATPAPPWPRPDREVKPRRIKEH